MKIRPTDVGVKFIKKTRSIPYGLFTLTVRFFLSDSDSDLMGSIVICRMWHTGPSPISIPIKIRMGKEPIFASNIGQIICGKMGFFLIQSVHSCVLLFKENKCRLLFMKNACFE